MKKILIIAFIISMMSCKHSTSLDDARKVKIGISENELKYIMGDPFSIDVNSDSEDWFFIYDSGPGINDPVSRMRVIMKNNKVAQFYSY